MLKPSERIGKIQKELYSKLPVGMNDLEDSLIIVSTLSRAIVEYLDEQHTKQEEETVKEHKCSHSCPIHPFLPPSSTPIVEECVHNWVLIGNHPLRISVRVFYCSKCLKEECI